MSGLWLGSFFLRPVVKPNNAGLEHGFDLLAGIAAYYVYSIVGKKDIVKGQSLMGIATAGICPMLANFLGGMMIETIPLKMILLIGIVIQVVAMLICFIATDKNRFQSDYQD